MMTLEELYIEDVALKNFLEDVWKKYEVDFRQYGKAHIKRRLRHRMTIAKYENFHQLAEDVLRDTTAFEGLFGDFSINVTELFRDPPFYARLAEILVAQEYAHPIKIWVAACASGEEAYSYIMLLDYLNIAVDQIIATDFNPKIVEIASRGSIDHSKMNDYLKNIKKSGVPVKIEKYFDAKHDCFQMKEEFLKKIKFHTHNLNNPHHFGNFDLISCRNVLIYFEKNLQNQVIDMFTNSLPSSGILSLGSKESLRFIDSYPLFETVSREHKVYKKK